MDLNFFFFSFLSRTHPGCKRDTLFAWKGLERRLPHGRGGSGLGLEQELGVGLRRVGLVAGLETCEPVPEL